MNPFTTTAALLTLGTLAAFSQNIPVDPSSDPLADPGPRPRKSLNEVTVVLPPPTPSQPTSPEPPASESPAPEPTDTAAENPPADSNPTTDTPPESGPVLVTGKPPEGAEVIAEPPSPESPKPEGLAVHVETLNPGSRTVDAKQVKLLAPFPAKPISQPPTGWKLQTSEAAPPFHRKVEIAPGSEVTLTVRPHLLVPDTDGSSSFSIPEPGYEPSLGYHQTATVGAILATSIRQLDEEAKQLGTAIGNLEQLLVSLPKPEPTEAPKASTPPPIRKK